MILGQLESLHHQRIAAQNGLVFHEHYYSIDNYSTCYIYAQSVNLLYINDVIVVQPRLPRIGRMYTDVRWRRAAPVQLPKEKYFGCTTGAARYV